MAEYSQIEIRAIWEKSHNAIDADQKGAMFEDLLAYLFGIVPGVKIVGRNVFNEPRSREIDIACSVNTKISDFSFLDPLFIVESKHTKKKTDSAEVNWFANKLKYMTLKTGIIISDAGISGTKGRAAFEEIRIAKMMLGVRILVVTKAEIFKLENTSQFAALLENKLTRLCIFDEVSC